VQDARPQAPRGLDSKRPGTKDVFRKEFPKATKGVATDVGGRTGRVKAEMSWLLRLRIPYGVLPYTLLDDVPAQEKSHFNNLPYLRMTYSHGWQIGLCFGTIHRRVRRTFKFLESKNDRSSDPRMPPVRVL
jgi:hypothetical protein